MMIKSTTLSWLLHDSSAYAIPYIKTIDKIMNFLVRSSYLFIRYSLRMLIGKKKRDKLDFYHRLAHKTNNISFSFCFYLFIYKVIKFLKLGNPSLIKIYVTIHNYKAYCPATLDDYSNMTEREENIIEHFYPKKGETIVDVGAHLGRYAMIGANRVGKHGKIIAIEAHPEVFEKLKRNIELNKFTNITCLNYAVYSQEKTKIKLFFPTEGLKDTIYNTVITDRSINSERFIEVNADTLDNILYENDIKHENVNWIKIDVEGAELEVLKGAHNILSKSKDIAILIEIHNLAEGRNLYKNIMDLLNNYNFKIEFEKIHDGGERHIIVRKEQL